MAVTSISEWSSTAASNTELDGISLAENVTTPSSVNNLFRELMSQVADYTRRGSDLASATTLDLDSIDTLMLNVTGTTTTTAITLTSGHWRLIRATAAWPITAGASLIVNGSTTVNYTATAGDYFVAEGYASSVVRLSLISSGGALLRAGFGQIQFPATQNASTNANTLDDYEEGTWVPTYSAGSGSFTTVTTNEAAYTKIGRVVFFRVDCTITNAGTAGAHLAFTTPFTLAAFYHGSGRETVGTGKQLQLIDASSTTVAAFFYDGTFPAATSNRLIMGGVFTV